MKPAEINLPAPLTPADCNLQDFAFMPLDVARLRDSDMAAYESPEACWAAVLLWSAAWHQVPAASLPDDDRFLAKAAGYGRVVKEWANVREGALHGWIKCADGRLYHPVVAEKANESWHKKVHYAWEKECDRIRKANKKREQEGKPTLPFPPEPKVHSVKIPAERDRIPPENQTHSAGNDTAFQTADESGAAVEATKGGCAAQELSDEPGGAPGKAWSDAFPPESTGIPPENRCDSTGNENSSAGIPLENTLKGQGEGQGQGEYKTPHTGNAAPAQPELRAGDPPQPTAVGQLSIAMRRFGINANPGDLRLIALADQGVTAATMQAACEEAKRVKRDAPIPPAFVFSIVERWAKEASGIQAAGAAQPQVDRTSYPARTEPFDPVAHVNRNRRTS